MASIRDIFGSNDSLKAQDLPEGVEVPVIIETVRPIQFDDGAKLVIGFRGKKKQLISNKTNSMRIADQIGDDFETWPGKTIFLVRAQTEFRGSIVPCVRVVGEPVARPASQLPQPAAAPAPAPVGVDPYQQRAAAEHQHENNPGEVPF